MMPREVYGVSFRWVMEGRVIRGLSTDWIRHGPSAGPAARDVHGRGYSERSSECQQKLLPIREECFLRYLSSFGKNKQKLTDSPVTPYRINGKR